MEQPPVVQGFDPQRVALLQYDVPLMTMTSDGHDPDVWSAPAKPHLWTIGAGLRESHGWDADRVGSYLAAAGGADGTWTAGQIADVVRKQAPS